MHAQASVFARAVEADEDTMADRDEGGALVASHTASPMYTHLTLAHCTFAKHNASQWLDRMYDTVSWTYLSMRGITVYTPVVPRLFHEL